MAVCAYWVNEEQSIVRYEFSGKWTWEEFYPVYKQAIAMEKSVPHRVDVVVDLRNSEVVPANALKHIRRIANAQPDNIGLTILVSTNIFILALYKIGCRIDDKVAHYFRVVSTNDEAFRLIDAARQT